MDELLPQNQTLISNKYFVLNSLLSSKMNIFFQKTENVPESQPVIDNEQMEVLIRNNRMSQKDMGHHRDNPYIS